MKNASHSATVKRIFAVAWCAMLFAGVFAVTADAAEPASPVDRSFELEAIAGEFQLADGPAWDGSWSLYVPDVKAQKLYRYIPRKKQLQVLLPSAGRISASFFNHSQLFLSDNGESQIAFLNGQEKVRIAGSDPGLNLPCRPNDLVVDNQGGIYYTLTKENVVAYIAPTKKQLVVADDIQTPNGIILSPDGKTLYVAEYAPKKIRAYDVAADGSLSGGREFAAMDAGPEKGADGMSIDRAGNVYCAGPSDIWIWSPAGELLDKIAVPTRPINCTFGDTEMTSLYITGFGGLYRQQMRISGRSPQWPLHAEPANSPEWRIPTAIPDSVTPYLDVEYARYGTRKLLADIFVPQGKSGPLPTLVVVHGGGWLKGDKTKFRGLAIELAKRGYVTAAIEYRLGGEAKFPAGIQDCNAAVRFLRAEAKQFSVDPNRIGAVGGSAGAHLVGLMATGADVKELQGDGGHPDYSSQLQAAIAMAGPMQMTTGSVADRSRTDPEKSNSNIWLGKGIDEAPELYQLADAYLHVSKNTPPLLFMAGEFDKPERNEATREKLKELGIPTGIKVYAKGKHGCWNRLPWFTDMVNDMDEFFRKHL